MQIEDLTSEQLQEYRLEGTDEQIPTFQQVLDLCDGAVPMIVELKSANGNQDVLTEKACAMLEEYKGLYCLESFDPRCIRWLQNNRPNLVRGQLAHNALGSDGANASWLLRFTMTNLLSNFWNMPDFIAYRFSDRNRLSVRISRKLWKIQGATWTLQSEEELNTAEAEKWIPIFEGFKP